MSRQEGVHRVVLASASPRRRMLLEQIGLAFDVRPSSAPEVAEANDRPVEHVQRAAALKAWSVVGDLEPETVVIGADTIVCLAGSVLGKPSGPSEAREMLHWLSGRTHTVYTGLAVGRSRDVAAMEGAPHQWRASGLATDFEATRVTFRRLSADEIRSYVATGEPLDKAGAYGIQGRGALLVREICGCYFNVVGLPLVRLARMLAPFGIEPLHRPKAEA